MKVAAIDIGTNSFILLIAEIINGKIIPIVEEFAIPRLGENIAHTHLISHDAIERSIEVLKHFKKIIDDNKVQNVYPIGTAVLREAKNSNIVASLLSEILNVPVKIISGEEESELSFIGAISNFKDEQEILTTIDIGGGSTELVIGSKEKIIDRISIPIGASKIKELFFSNDQYSDDFIESANSFIDKNLGNLDNFFSNKLVGIGGTITTLAFILSGINTYDDNIINGFQLAFNDNYLLFQKLINFTPFELAKRFNIDLKRADILLSGQLILIKIQEKLKKKNIQVSSKGLRFGVIEKYLRIKR